MTLQTDIELQVPRRLYNNMVRASQLATLAFGPRTQQHSVVLFSMPCAQLCCCTLAAWDALVRTRTGTGFLLTHKSRPRHSLAGSRCFGARRGREAALLCAEHKCKVVLWRSIRRLEQYSHAECMHKAASQQWPHQHYCALL